MIADLILSYTPFLQPLKIWDYWLWLLIPLCFAVSLVYKSVRVEPVIRIPVEAAKATFWILLGMGAAAAGLWLVVYFVGH